MHGASTLCKSKEHKDYFCGFVAFVEFNYNKILVCVSMNLTYFIKFVLNCIFFDHIERLT